MTKSKKPYPIGSPEAKAVIQKVREQELARAGMITDGYNRPVNPFKNRVQITEELRSKVLKMLDEGIDRKEIARKTGISYSSVARIAAKYR